MEIDATFWAMIALFIFLGVVVYLKVPGMLTKNLDDRAAGIRSELDEAKNCVKKPRQFWRNISENVKKPNLRLRRSLLLPIMKLRY